MVLEILSRILEHFTGSVRARHLYRDHLLSITKHRRQKKKAFDSEPRNGRVTETKSRVDGDYRMWRTGPEKSAAVRLGGDCLQLFAVVKTLAAPGFSELS